MRNSRTTVHQRPSSPSAVAATGAGNISETGAFADGVEVSPTFQRAFILTTDGVEEEHSMRTRLSNNRMQAAAVLCLWALLSARSAAVTAQVDDPFAPSPQVAHLTSQLKGVRHQLITSKSPEEVIGIDFRDDGMVPPIRQIQLKELAAIDQLKSFKTLRFDQPYIGDEWLLTIGKCKDLEGLSIANAAITSKGTSALAKLNLTRAGFAGCKQLDDDAMETVADWEKLRQLYLADVPITDSGIHIIRGLSELEVLDLSWNDTAATSGVTNASLETLRGFTKLRELNINGTLIDREGAAELEKALPNCRLLH